MTDRETKTENIKHKNNNENDIYKLQSIEFNIN